MRVGMCVTNAAGPVDIIFGPDDALYYVSFIDGAVNRVTSSGDEPTDPPQEIFDVTKGQAKLSKKTGGNPKSTPTTTTTTPTTTRIDPTHPQWGADDARA